MLKLTILNNLFLQIHPYEKNDSKTRKITQLCQLNLLSIDYPNKREKCTIGAR